MTTLSTISAVVGWAYFLAWSVSFYPQVILNFRRRSVVGLSLEFQIYNITGFLAYSVYNVVGFIQQRRLDLTKSITTNDVAFALHAFVIQLITCIQCLIFKTKFQTVNKWHAALACSFWLLALYNVGLSIGGILPWSTTTDQDYPFNTVAFLGYTKSAISLVKYTPQAYMNWKRQSTVGWSIGNILLDFTGGTLSTLQQFLDAIDGDDWGVFTKNVPKLLLGLFSMMFDILFLVQHYCLYRGNVPRDPEAPESQRLAGSHVDGADAYDVEQARESELPYEHGESDTQRSNRSSHSNASQKVKYFPVSYNENGNGATLSSPTAAGTSARSDAGHFANFAVGSTSIGRSFSNPRSPMAATTSTGNAAAGGGFINAFAPLPPDSERVDFKVGLGSLGSRSSSSQLPRSATLPPNGVSVSINGEVSAAESSVTQQSAMMYEQLHGHQQGQHQRAVSSSAAALPRHDDGPGGS